jgi:leucyl-tRNA synthetase
MAKSNTKLTNLLTIEKDIQAKWTSEKIFEEDAPDLNDANTKR